MAHAPVTTLLNTNIIQKQEVYLCFKQPIKDISFVMFILLIQFVINERLGTYFYKVHIHFQKIVKNTYHILLFKDQKFLLILFWSPVRQVIRPDREMSIKRPESRASHHNGNLITVVHVSPTSRLRML